MLRRKPFRVFSCLWDFATYLGNYFYSPILSTKPLHKRFTNICVSRNHFRFPIPLAHVRAVAGLLCLNTTWNTVREITRRWKQYSVVVLYPTQRLDVGTTLVLVKCPEYFLLAEEFGCQMPQLDEERLGAMGRPRYRFGKAGTVQMMLDASVGKVEFNDSV